MQNGSRPAPDGSTPALPESLVQAVQQWVRGDPDEGDRAELSGLVERGAASELVDRFGGSLAFGTAGLRGLLGAGPNRMNRAVVIRATAGLAAHLMAAVPEAGGRGVVVGFDARTGSRDFAAEAAAVLTAAGIRVYCFAQCVPTPLVAFAVRRLRAAGGIVITASHNPAGYNGYKVYWEDGAQIVSPTDEHIAQAIAAAPAAAAVPRHQDGHARALGLLLPVPQEVTSAYLDGVRGLCLRPKIRPPLRVVYTPVHGVGLALVREAFRAAGFAEPIVVPQQAEPDGKFPTTPFPNPEESGVLDLALALAEREHADLVLANDPDADRLAAAIPGPDGRFLRLTGNQLGSLLGHYVMEMRDSERPAAVVSSIVSSPMLGEMARALGIHYETTLTGFKWMEKRASELERQSSMRVLFIYEEALGYSIGALVRDKDGVSAAVLFAELAAVCRARGTSVLSHLESLYRRFGLYASRQVNLQQEGAEASARLAEAMRRLRTSPPVVMGGRRILSVSDYATGLITSVSCRERPTNLPQSNVLAFEVEGGTRITMRPSGTEPKLKIYLDHREAIADDEPFAIAEARADAVLAAMEREAVSLLRTSPSGAAPR